MATATGPWTAAWEALQAGRPAEAERLCRQAIQAAPESIQSWYLLGLAGEQQGQPNVVVEAYTRVLRVRPDIPELLNNLGNALRRLGRLPEALDALQRAAQLRPDIPEIHNNLGNVLRDIGRLPDAEASFRWAVQLRPNYSEAHDNLGTTLRDLGRPVEAEQCHRRAMELRPKDATPRCNLGCALLDQGRADEATDSFVESLRLQPDFPEGHFNLGNVQQLRGRVADAEVCYRRALQFRPAFPEALYNLANILRDADRLGDADEHYRRAIELRPGYAAAHNNLGIALGYQGRRAEAEACYRRALELRPDYVEAYSNVGNARWNQGDPVEAETWYRRAIDIRPSYAEAHNNLGIVLRETGRHADAVASYRRALELRPDYAEAHDGLLMTLHYCAGVSLRGLAEEHAEYQRHHADALRATWQPFANDRDPERPLRIGLVSPDFGRHPVSYLLVQAVEALARRTVVTCYSDRRYGPDEFTRRFRAAASLWHDTAGMNDERLADQIRTDKIDVLIDLAGHTALNRLLVFARKPAPLQATWLGYEGTTGLDAVDYLIADDRLVPAESEQHHHERVLRLPGGYAAYDPPPDSPEPGPPPTFAAGRVTFGCFNNPAKLSVPAIAAFADVLRRVPGSRLILKYRGLDDPVAASRFREEFAASGTDLDRIEWRGISGYGDYLSAYREVDVALDPFPFGGGVTTCDALWMGVPVITLPGETFASRHGLGYLWAVGLADQFAACDADDYAARAAALAADTSRLAGLRAGLRDRMARSPLCDGDRLADELLAALRGAWRAWTSGEP